MNRIFDRSTLCYQLLVVALQFLCRTDYGRIHRRHVNLGDLLGIGLSSIGNLEYDIVSVTCGYSLDVGIVESGVSQAITEGIEGLDIEVFFTAVAKEHAFGIFRERIAVAVSRGMERSGMIPLLGGVLVESAPESEGQSSGRRHLAAQDGCNRVAALLSWIPVEDYGLCLVRPGCHVEFAAGIGYDDDILVV